MIVGVAEMLHFYKIVSSFTYIKLPSDLMDSDTRYQAFSDDDHHHGADLNRTSLLA